MSIEEDINELKILLFQDRLTNYGKRKMINYYENEIARQKQINEEHQKEIAELKEYIFIAPNLDEMTATKYANIQREGYIRGRAEEQERAEYIIYKNYIPKQKIKEKIEELKNEKEQLRIDKNVTWDSQIYKIDLKIQVLQELLQEEDK